MIVVLFIALFAAVAGAIWYLKWRARQARIHAVQALAERIGFTYTQDDVERVVGMPFELFGRGDGRKVELVISGTHNNLPLRLFDYWYYDESTDGHGNRSRSYHRFTCALLTIPVAVPHLRLSRENFLTRLGDHLGLHDVELEYEDFNKRFRVKCDDQKFAFSLLDGQMMEWLLNTDGFDCVEIVGPWVMLARPQLEPAVWLDLGTWLDAFRGHVPEVVYTTFPPR